MLFFLLYYCGLLCCPANCASWLRFGPCQTGVQQIAKYVQVICLWLWHYHIMFGEKSAIGFWFSSGGWRLRRLIYPVADVRPPQSIILALSFYYVIIIKVNWHAAFSGTTICMMKELLLKILVFDEMIGAAYDEGFY